MIRGMRVMLPCVAVCVCSSVYVCVCVCAHASNVLILARESVCFALGPRVERDLRRSEKAELGCKKRHRQR